MAKQERTRKSAPQNRVKSAQLTKGVIEPWDELTEKERAIFDAVIASRENDTWLDADIEAATKLARIAVEMNECWDQLKTEGRIIYTDKGWPAANPLVGLYAQLSGLYQKHRTGLGLTASQRGVSGNKQAKRNKQDAAAIRDNEAASADKIASLIARPKVI